VRDRQLLERTLLELADDVTASLRRHGLMARGVTLKLRYDDFTTLTRSQAMQEAIDSTGLLHAQALSLFNAVALSRPVRLIGVTAGPLVSSSNRQYSLFDEPVAEQSRKIDIALDAVRQRFGTQAIRRARLVEGEVGKESADDA